MRDLKIATLSIISLISLAACAQDKPASSKPIGMANPASVYCVSLGGKLEIKRQADGGEYGLCHLPDGSAVEEWTLFRRDHAKEQEKPVGMSNPASEYCVKQGGKPETKRQTDGSEYGVCHLPNGKTIGEWELFRRDNHPSNKM